MMENNEQHWGNVIIQLSSIKMTYGKYMIKIKRMKAEWLMGPIIKNTWKQEEKEYL